MMARLDLQQIVRFFERLLAIVETDRLIDVADQEGDVVGFTAR
jgi:hypothetical protein